LHDAGGRLGSAAVPTTVAPADITDSGTLVEPKLTGSCGNNQVVLHIVRVVSGSQGNFTLRIDSPIVGEEPNGNVEFAGHWVVIAGTGAYADLHGQGTRSAVADPTTGIVTETLTGTVHHD
jgi:hypothetical protein